MYFDYVYLFAVHFFYQRVISMHFNYVYATKFYQGVISMHFYVYIHLYVFVLPTSNVAPNIDTNIRAKTQINLSQARFLNIWILQVKVLCYRTHLCEGICLFDLTLYVLSTIFQLRRDGSSCVEPVPS